MIGAERFRLFGAERFRQNPGPEEGQKLIGYLKRHPEPINIAVIATRSRRRSPSSSR